MRRHEVEDVVQKWGLVFGFELVETVESPAVAGVPVAAAVAARAVATAVAGVAVAAAVRAAAVRAAIRAVRAAVPIGHARNLFVCAWALGSEEEELAEDTNNVQHDESQDDNLRPVAVDHTGQGHPRVLRLRKRDAVDLGLLLRALHAHEKGVFRLKHARFVLCAVSEDGSQVELILSSRLVFCKQPDVLHYFDELIIRDVGRVPVYVDLLHNPLRVFVRDIFALQPQQATKLFMVDAPAAIRIDQVKRRLQRVHIIGVANLDAVLEDGRALFALPRHTLSS
mmetsp:Transcript_39067/g.90002  ORF Transcript_39067/g.90002 Transcript_39067/m.90002 type:complete len:282 (-) Transcript_39067:432-1277(-)